MQAIKDKIKEHGITQVIKLMTNASDKNLDRIGYFMEKMSGDKENKDRIKLLRGMIKENHPGIQLVRRITNETNKKCRDKIATNLIAKGFLINDAKRKKTQKEGSYAPSTVLISPTMRCNIRCIGCYAGNYTMKDDLSFELFDKVVTESKAMGTAFFTILGGEPFIRKDLFDILKKHNDTYFQIYTNGTLLDEEKVKKLAKLGNAMPVLSIEGSEEQTDWRRGKGVYKKVIKAMKLLKKHKVPFGFSTAVTSKNADYVTSDEYVDMLIKNGAFVGWYFLYMPIGRDADLSLMPTPKQRKAQYHRIEEIRATKPIFMIDFWNDAPSVGGCIAGREYVHITSKGDAEPCIFSHFAEDNIKNKSMKQIMSSNYFKTLRSKQPYTDNLFLPCMWIDNPEVSREVHASCNVYPTHDGAEEIIMKPSVKKGLDKYSKEVHKMYKELWADRCKGCGCGSSAKTSKKKAKA